MQSDVGAEIVWVLDKLIWLIAILIGFIVKRHLDSDAEFRSKVEGEINKIKEKLHV